MLHCEIVNFTAPRHRIIENEKRRLQEKKGFIEDYDKRLAKEEEFLLSIVQQKIRDKQRCEEMKIAIEKNRKDMQTLKSTIDDLENENLQLKSQVENADAMILNNIINEESVSKKSNNSDNLRSIYKTIRNKLIAYKKYLGCSIDFEEPNFYVFSFLLSNDQKEGFIKFQRNNSDWTIINFEPKDLLSNEDVDEFHTVQDTQKLLSPLLLK